METVIGRVGHAGMAVRAPTPNFRVALTRLPSGTAIEVAASASSLPKQDMRKRFAGINLIFSRLHDVRRPI